MWRAAALSAAKLPPHVSLWIRRRRSSNGQTSVIKRGMIVQTEQERPGAWLDHVGESDGHRNCFEWFAEESKSIAEQATEPAQREKFVKLASLWANAMLESTSATSLPRRDSAEATGAI
jgi:hypothetical protein